MLILTLYLFLAFKVLAQQEVFKRSIRSTGAKVRRDDKKGTAALALAGRNEAKTRSE